MLRFIIVFFKQTILGNELLHLLTTQGQYALRVDMWDWEGHRAYAEYSSFKVDDSSVNYMLHVSEFKGDAGKHTDTFLVIKILSTGFNSEIIKITCSFVNGGP